MNAILSIKPIYANQIIAGTKTVEFRKAVFKRPVERVYIYSSAPEMKIVGYFTIRQIVKDSPKALWKQFRKVGGINKADFFAYYAGKSEGYTLCIESVVSFEEGIDPKKVIDGFVPPQSFRYLNFSLDPRKSDQSVGIGYSSGEQPEPPTNPSSRADSTAVCVAVS